MAKTIIWHFKDWRHYEAGDIYFRSKSDATIWLWERTKDIPTMNSRRMEHKRLMEWVHRVDIRDGDSIDNYYLQEIKDEIS